MKNEPGNAITLLMNDHADVKEMFAKFEELSDRSKAGKKRLADAICEALTLHTRIEEEIFYPAARKALKDGDMMDEALVEHACAKELIAQIQSMDPGEELYDAKVKVLSEQIEHHVKEEETEMFPKVRTTSLDLVALGQEMLAYKESAHA
jgi:hypothetical protein